MYQANRTYINKKGVYVICGTKVNSIKGEPLKFYDKLKGDAIEDNPAEVSDPSNGETTKQD